MIQLSHAILESAKPAGADCIMVACPLGHGNLDIRQKEIEGVYSTRLRHAGLLHHPTGGPGCRPEADKLGLDALFVNPMPLLKEKGLL